MRVAVFQEVILSGNLSYVASPIDNQTEFEPWESFTSQSDFFIGIDHEGFVRIFYSALLCRYERKPSELPDKATGDLLRNVIKISNPIIR